MSDSLSAGCGSSSGEGSTTGCLLGTGEGSPACRIAMVLAIDPGYEQSAWVLWDGRIVVAHTIEPNPVALERFRYELAGIPVVLEQIESFGMAVGREVFETVFWTGRFYEAAKTPAREPQRMPRKAVKLHLCQSARAQDTNIRTALMDRFGGKVAALGSKKSPGPLYGIKSHEWSALAIAVTWFDQHVTERTAAHV